MLTILKNIFLTICLLLFIAVTALVIERQLNVFQWSADRTATSTVAASSTSPERGETLLESIDMSLNLVEDTVVEVVGTYIETDEDLPEVESVIHDASPTEEVLTTDVVPEPITSTPLTVFDTESGELSVGGVVLYTNTERFQNGQIQLTPNTLLHGAAKRKIDDMLANQYFEHESPVTGHDVSYLAKVVGYEYIVVGENLAMGDFSDDADLVQGWMDSPGHRDNILNERFTEIGVAVRKGEFEGREIWMAVQIFGRPLELCDSPSATLETEITNTQQELDKREATLEVLNSQIESAKNTFSQSYRDLVDEYNLLVNEYNALVEGLKDMIADYNRQVRTFNTCLAE